MLKIPMTEGTLLMAPFGGLGVVLGVLPFTVVVVTPGRGVVVVVVVTPGRGVVVVVVVAPPQPFRMDCKVRVYEVL